MNITITGAVASPTFRYSLTSCLGTIAGHFLGSTEYDKVVTALVVTLTLNITGIIMKWLKRKMQSLLKQWVREILKEEAQNK